MSQRWDDFLLIALASGSHGGSLTIAAKEGPEPHRPARRQPEGKRPQRRRIATVFAHTVD
jgi:hypothetical protein